MNQPIPTKQQKQVELTFFEPSVTIFLVKRTDMNRLSDPSLPHSFTSSLPPESSSDKPPTRTKLTWSEVN